MLIAWYVGLQKLANMQTYKEVLVPYSGGRGTGRCQSLWLPSVLYASQIPGRMPMLHPPHL